MRRTFAILLVCGLAAAGWMSTTWRSPAPRPLPPPAVRGPYDPTLTHKTLEFWAGRAKQDPGALNLNFLAGMYNKSCRETGDITDAVRAEQAARRSIALRTRNNAAAFDALALSLLSQHRFHEALDAADHAATLASNDQQAVNLRAEIKIELGDYTAAEHLMRSSTFPSQDPSGQTVWARLFEIQGKPQLALQYYQQAQRLADQNFDMPRESVAWFHMRTGNCLAAMGQAPEAERSYFEALTLFPRDYRTLTSMARLAAGENDWKNTIRWAEQSMAIVPTPDAAALLGDAEAALGNQKAAAAQYHLVDVIALLAKSLGAVYDRQRAMFDADHNCHLDEGLTLAERELKVRQDIYAYDTVAWTYYQKGLLPEAAAAIDRAMAHRTRDALLFYHAGMIARARGDRVHAKTYLQTALDINPYFHPSGPQLARQVLKQIS